MSAVQPGGAREWIFVSYRRDDSFGFVDLLYKQLTARYGPASVFLDTMAIAPGATFPPRIEQAVRGARVVIAVIGPQWLTSIDARTKSAELDYVREELRLAIERRNAAEDAVDIFTVMVNNAKQPDFSLLTAELQAELGALRTINSCPLRPLPDWDRDLEALFKLLDPVRAALPAVYAAQSEVEKKLREEIAKVLAKPHMSVVRSAWGDEAVEECSSSQARAQLLALNRAIIESNEIWSQSGRSLTAEQAETIKKSCRELATLLYRLAIDITAVRQWQHRSEPAPVKEPGTAALVWAAMQGSRVVACLPKGASFGVQRTVDLEDGLDAGIGKDRSEQVLRELWHAAEMKDPLPSGAPTDEHRNSLLIRMENLAERDRQPFGITAVTPTPASHDELGRLARAFEVKDYPRTGRPGPLLRIEEARLADALNLCLQDIEKIR